MRVQVLIASQIANKDLELSLCVLHEHICMRLFFQNLQYLSRLSSMNALDYTDTFAWLKELSQLLSSRLDLYRDLVFSHNCRNLSLTNVFDCALAPHELASDDLAAITHLNLQLGVIPYCLENSAVFKQVPFVEVRRVAMPSVRSGLVKLKATYFTQLWTRHM